MSTTWTIDPTHSEVGFTVKHMMITKVNGTFDAVNAVIDAEDGFKNAVIEATIETASVNTRNEQRDGHLKSADFFDVENHPIITFKAEVSELASGTLNGEFSMHGVTKTIPLNIDFYGEVTDPWGNKKTGMSFEATINRKDFGLVWNAALETGGVLVSEDVKLRGELQFVKNA
jgi:polyisoprenoid-binding protein YceI